VSETFPQEWGTEPPAPASPPAGAPREFTAEELDAARAQLLAQGATGIGTGPAATGEALGLSAMAAGAEATEVDAGAMLAAIRALQAKVDALEREKRAAQAPDVVKYAQALFDHLAVKAVKHPHTQADPDHTWGQAPGDDGTGGRGVLGAAGKIVTAAGKAADTGHPGTLAADLGKVETWVKRHARRFPHIDYSYVLELAEDAAQAVTLLAA